MKKYSVLLWLLLTPLQLSIGAPFRNLDFEEANTLTLTTNRINGERFGTVSDLLPAWQVFQGTNMLISISFDPSSVPFGDDGGVALEDYRRIEGKYSLTIRVPGGRPDPFYLRQRGDIPSDARFLTFNSSGGLALGVRIDGTILYEPNPFVRPTLVDISQFAGKNVELEFSTNPLLGSQTYLFDNIVFVVPEPSTTALLVFGSLALAARWLWPRLSARRGKNAN